MGLFRSKPKPTSFTSAVESTAAALVTAQQQATTVEEWTQVAAGWQALVEALNPVHRDDDE